MKRKIKKFAGDEGSVVYDKYNREDEGLLGAKIKYREDEEGRKYTAGRANPMDRASVARGDVQEQRYYSVNDIKGKLSGLFGGSSEDSKSFSKFKDLESVGGAGRRPRTIEEQIGRKATPKASEQDTEEKSNRGERAQTNMMPKGNYEYKGSMPEASDETPAPVTRNSNSGSGRSSSGSSSSSAVPKADKKADAPKADKKADAPKTADKPYPKDARPLKLTTGEKAAIKKRGEQDDADQESLRKQFEKNAPKAADNKPNRYPAILEDKKTESKPADAPKKTESKSADAPKKTEKIYGQGLTPYEKSRTLSEWSKMLGGGKKETAKETSKSNSKDDAEKLAATRRRAAGMFQKTNEGVYGMKKGGSVSSASSRGDGIAARGKTRGKIC